MSNPRSFLKELSTVKRSILDLLHQSQAVDFDGIVAVLAPEIYQDDVKTGIIAIALIHLISDRQIVVSFDGSYPAKFSMVKSTEVSEVSKNVQ